MATEYYYGHGEAFLGTRTAGGEVDNFDIQLPEIDSLTISFSEEKIEHISKRNAIASKDLSVPHMVTGTGTIVVAEHSYDMLVAYLFGAKSTVTGGSFSAKAFASGIVAGDIMPLPAGITHASSIVITDSTGSPKTLTAGTNYRVSASGSSIYFDDVTTGGTFTQPFIAAGTEAAGTGVGLLKTRTVEKALRFEGINVANGDEACVVDLYRVQLSPASSWNLMNDGTDVNKYEIAFELLKDTTKESSDTFGQYGRYRGI